MFNIAIVEDEEKQYKVLEEYIKRYEKEENVSFRIDAYRDGMSFLDEYKTDCDIVLMDIAMPHMNGLETAMRLRRIDERVCLVFITTLAKYAIRGYEVNAFDFLLKPVEYDLFRIKLSKALLSVKKKRNDSYSIMSATGMKKIPLDDIVYIESDKHYLCFHTRQGEYKMRDAIKNILPYFSENNFVLINRSLLVNLLHVNSFKGNDVCVGSEILPLSRIYKAEFLKKLSEFIGRGF